MPQAYVVDKDKSSALSVGGGDHWEISDADGLLVAAEAGDFIVFGELYGVALNDYDADRESIVVSTQGGYVLEVVAVDNAGGEAIYQGSWLYWDVAAGEINRDATNGAAIGQALEAVTAGETAEIGVLLRPQAP
jgi:predicted RecA/RadA family phage recombinase